MGNRNAERQKVVFQLNKVFSSCLLRFPTEDKEIKRVDEVENDIACASLLLKSHESNQLQLQVSRWDENSLLAPSSLHPRLCCVVGRLGSNFGGNALNCYK